MDTVNSVWSARPLRVFPENTSCGRLARGRDKDVHECGHSIERKKERTTDKNNERQTEILKKRRKKKGRELKIIVKEQK